MGTGHVDRPVALWSGAGAVPRLEDSPLRGRDRARRPPDIDHHRVSLDHAMQGAIAGQALHRLARDRHPVAQLRGHPAELALEALDGGVDADVRPRAIAPRQPALVHGVLGHLDQGIRPALLGRASVIRAQRVGERLDGRLERRPADRIQPGVEPVHAAGGLADVQRAQLVVLFALALEALAVPADAGFVAQVAQILEGELLGVSDPVLLIDVLPLLADLLAEMTDHRRRLVADLAGAQSLGDPGQVAQLLADTESVRRRGLGHLALHRHPGAGALPGKQVIASLPGRTENPAKLALQPVNGGAQASGIDEIVVRLAIEIGDRTLETFEFSRHARIIRTKVRNVQSRPVNLYSPNRPSGTPNPLLLPL